MKVVVVVGFHTGSGGGGVFGRALRAEAAAGLRERSWMGRSGASAEGLGDDPSDVDLSLDDWLRWMGLLDEHGELSEADEYGYESGHEPHAPLPEECYRACLWEREELGWANHRKGE